MKAPLVSLETALLAGVSAVNHLCICSRGASDVVSIPSFPSVVPT